MGNVSHIAGEAIEGQREVKTFGGHAYERDRFEGENETNRQLNLKLMATSAASVPIVQLIAAASAGMVMAVALSDENLSVGSFVSFLAAMMMLLQPMKRLTKIAANIQRGIAAARSIFEFIDTPSEVDSGTERLDKVDGLIEFDHVGFRYPSSENAVLSNINLKVQPGQTVALVGRSGSGKTTLVNLLPRFYEMESGTISIDGQDINHLTLASLRGNISLVSQHITLFNDTIANNIAYGSPITDENREQTMAALREAAEAAHALEFIEQLPNGFDTEVGENGVLLSGGQRQRLAIARALWRNAPILILDEATSALDTHSERHIQAALENLMQHRTTLVIAHRLSTIERADQIVVLDRGEIAEQGSHQQLLDQHGLYAALYRMQFVEDEVENTPEAESNNR